MVAYSLHDYIKNNSINDEDFVMSKNNDKDYTQMDTKELEIIQIKLLKEINNTIKSIYHTMNFLILLSFIAAIIIAVIR